MVRPGPNLEFSIFMPKSRVFILECPNALELLVGTGESGSLQHVCALFEHEPYTFMLRDSDDLKRSLAYIGSAGWHDSESKSPIFIHMSTHGDSGDGLTLGQDDVSWCQLGHMLLPMLEGLHFGGNGYPGPLVLVISACDSAKQTLTQYLSSAYLRGQIKLVPSYVFLIADSMVYWADAVVTWTIFYREVLNAKGFRADKHNEQIKAFVERLNSSKYGNLAYFRWDPEKTHYHRIPKRTG